MTIPAFDALPWDGARRLRFGDTAVDFCVDDPRGARQAALMERESTDECFVLGKTPQMLKRTLAELRYAPKRIVDVGVFKGGSVVLLNELFQPEALLAIERNPQDKPPLQRYLAARGGGRVTWRRGIDQADRAALHAACDRAFGTAPIDLVIDDASHWYPQTLATFSALFPRLAPGGLYVVEDWGWAHWPDEHWQVGLGGEYFADKLPVSNLIIDLALLSAALPDVFPRVTFDGISIYVERGTGPITRDFHVPALVHNRGQPLPRFATGVAGKRSAYESPEFTFRVGQR